MPIECFRVDDRLVHGQVVVGWGQSLRLGFIVLVDDTVAANDWECELYSMGTPPEMTLFVETTDSVVLRLPEFDARADAGMLLTADIPTMGRLVQSAPRIRAVNIGGVHHRIGRTWRLPYVFLSPEDDAALAAIASCGVRVTAQDLPGADEVPLEALLSGGPA
ncbi:MAG: PTS sugar transporter subunit IIB [Gemmatimonadetes bacterium]|nr:PTS sugar transporter subunit IIB [Gemmatimonadota bacterium]